VQAVRLGLIGAEGRMGTALRRYVEGIEDITVHATLEKGESFEAFIGLKPEVVVDLSLGPAVDEHAAQIVSAGLPYIVGATGYSDDTLSRLLHLSAEHNTPVLVVPNFSLGANLLIRFSTQAASLMDSPVITERHHAGKADAPSGTARFTAERIAKGRAASSGGTAPATALPQCHESVAGVLGGHDHGVQLHSLRGAGYLAEQEVRFCLPGETLCIEHRSIDRACFMPGIVYAIRNIGRVQGFAYGLDTLLELQ